MPVRAENASDSDLVAAIRKSEAGAFKLLYFRYYEMLFTFLWRRTRERETAQDLVQELFARVWQQREKLAPAPSLKPYLYRIAHHLAIDHLRKKSVAGASVDALSQPAADQPDELFDLQDRLEAALQRLPETVYTVFYLNRFEGMKYAEIAELLDISIKTVEARMSKALAFLRKALHAFLSLLLLLYEFSF